MPIQLLTTCLILISLTTSWVYADHLSQAPSAKSKVSEPTLKLALQQALDNTTSFDDRYTAEIWVNDMSQRLKSNIRDENKRLHLLRILYQEAHLAKLPPELLMAIIDIESSFNRWAVSPAGAQGLMQVMPFWLNELGQPDGNLHQIRTNLRIGSAILKYYINREKGDIRTALARYNGSYGHNHYPDKVFNALKTRWYKQ